MHSPTPPPPSRMQKVKDNFEKVTTTALVNVAVPAIKLINNTRSAVKRFTNHPHSNLRGAFAGFAAGSSVESWSEYLWRNPLFNLFALGVPTVMCARMAYKFHKQKEEGIDLFKKAHPEKDLQHAFDKTCQYAMTITYGAAAAISAYAANTRSWEWGVTAAGIVATSLVINSMNSSQELRNAQYKQKYNKDEKRRQTPPRPSM